MIRLLARFIEERLPRPDRRTGPAEDPFRVRFGPLLVLDRRRAAEYRPVPGASTAGISIFDEGTAPPSLLPGFAEVLQRAFDDVVDGQPAHYATPFQSSHAEAIVRFAERHRDADTILVHCEGGYSRSPAVAASIARRHAPDLAPAILARFPNANDRVLRLLHDAFALHERRDSGSTLAPSTQE